MILVEKTRLARDLPTLPPEKHTQALAILNSHNTNVKDNNNNEFEFEIDDVDTETLWELERLVTNWKKSRNKKPTTVRHGRNKVTPTKRLESNLKKNMKDLREGDQDQDIDIIGTVSESDLGEEVSVVGIDNDDSSSDSNSTSSKSEC